MLSDQPLEATRAYYERGDELGRLATGSGEVELERTKEIILRHLPAAPAIVADIGGGPGRYALWLARLGYRVLHRDLMPLHVSQLRQSAAGEPGIDSAVADARDLDLGDHSADAVLLLGPLYHLERRPAGRRGWTESLSSGSTRRFLKRKRESRRSSAAGACHRYTQDPSTAVRTARASSDRN